MLYILVLALIGAVAFFFYKRRYGATLQFNRDEFYQRYPEIGATLQFNQDEFYQRYPDIKEKKLSFNDTVKYCLSGVTEPSDLKKRQHFYLVVKTDSPGLTVPTPAREKYFKKEQAVIVLDRSFRISLLEETLFHVELYFDGAKSTLTIPYSAILVFADPPIGFAISRKTSEEW